MKSMKNIFFSIFLLFSAFLFMDTVKAEDCVYGAYLGGSSTWSPQIKLKVDSWNHITLSNDSAILRQPLIGQVNLIKCDSSEECDFKGTDLIGYKNQFYLGLYIDQNAYNAYKASGSVCPPRIQYCMNEDMNWFVSGRNHYIYTDGLTKQQIDSGFSWAHVYTSKATCLVYNEQSKKDEEYSGDVEFSECMTYNAYLNAMTTAKDTTGSCDNNELFQTYYDQISDVCSKYMSSTDYAGQLQGSTEAKACMTACSHIRDDVVKICNYSTESNTTKECASLGERLIAWIFKIFNWMRYIVPALLIILGVLDFIKAIAADSEEDIKKAGARFSKRLIAAALVFIIPLILQFVLGMFSLPGLDPNNPFCEL